MAIVHVTNDNFDTEVLKATKPVVVDFWATWCGPCRALGPVLEELDSENSDIKICKVNVDEQSELAVKFGIMSIPTMIFFKNGEQTEKIVGLTNKSEILEKLK